MSNGTVFGLCLQIGFYILIFSALLVETRKER